VLTTGVPAKDVVWPWERGGHAGRIERRRDEGRQAAELLGLSAIEFLDLPTRTLRTELLDVRGRILQTMAKFQADALWAPAYEGAHSDHDSANVLAASVRDGSAKTPAVYEYVEYNFFGGAIHSQTFPDPRGTEVVLELTPAEVELKRKAMAVYQSAQGDLNYVKIERESLRPLAIYDYSRPPHPGKLFYQRFQWVPFRHPRVDFTLPEQVCRDVADFQRALATAGIKA
jgi:LmbE family N-acetylglucosaminyl deacetylase